MRNDFAIFILTHGRPNEQFTLQTLFRVGYTGKYFLVLDDTDDTIQQYIDKYGAENIVIFNKNYYLNSDRFDNGDNKLHSKCAVYARRAIEDIAKEFNYKYFIMAEDDITNLSLRIPINNKLRRISITNLDIILDKHLSLFTNDVCVIGFGNPAHYFGGISIFSVSSRFIPVQFIMRATDIELDWLSWFAEDDISGYMSSAVGYLWLTSFYIMIQAKPVGDFNNDGIGGNTDTYKLYPNKYELNFNAIKWCPQLSLKYRAKLGTFEFNRPANNLFPKIIGGVYKNENIICGCRHISG